MAKYQARPVLVDAFQIVSVDGESTDKDFPGVRLTLDSHSKVIADPTMTSRMTPKVGDYWVIQGDGYIYLNPKDVFERKYGPVEPNAFELGSAVRKFGLSGK